mgnify:CR=1 FL=1|jgi:hypothetical protein
MEFMLNKTLWNNDIIICPTFDMDWESEDALKYTLNILDKFGLPATFFVTHYSKIVFNRIKNKEIHGGIHPNFLKNSIQGKDIDEVINYCTRLLPEANCFRCHKYYDSDDAIDKLKNIGFKYDSSIYTNLEKKEPFIHKSGLLRFPVFFDDEAYLLHNNSLNFKEFERRIFKEAGLYVFNFHPMYLSINSPDYQYMKKIKDTIPKNTWINLTNKELEHLNHKGRGVRSFTLDLFHYIKKKGLKTITLDDAYNIIITSSNNK